MFNFIRNYQTFLNQLPCSAFPTVWVFPFSTKDFCSVDIALPLSCFTYCYLGSDSNISVHGATFFFAAAEYSTPRSPVIYSPGPLGCFQSFAVINPVGNVL